MRRLPLSYAEQPRKYAFTWRFKLCLLFILFGIAVIRNSGCTAFLNDSSVNTEIKAAHITAKESSKSLSISPNTVELYPQSNFSAMLRVEGGQEPYAFFVKGSDAFTLDVVSQDSAKLKLKENAKLSNVEDALVYVLDGGGNVASADIRISSAEPVARLREKPRLAPAAGAFGPSHRSASSAQADGSP